MDFFKHVWVHCSWNIDKHDRIDWTNWKCGCYRSLKSTTNEEFHYYHFDWTCQVVLISHEVIIHYESLTFNISLTNYYDISFSIYFSCDTLVIITSIFMFSFTVFRHTETFVFTYYYLHIYPKAVGFVYPIALCCQTGSAYLTLAVTLERYIAVCWSLKARHLCTQASIWLESNYSLFGF